MRQVVEVPYVVALEFKTGAVTCTAPQCVLNILKGIPEHQVPAVFQVVALPWVSELGEALQNRKEPKIHRAHIEGCEFRHKRDRGLNAFLNSHVRRASACQIYHGVGRLFDSWQECGKRRETVVWFTRLRIARMQMHDR